LFIKYAKKLNIKSNKTYDPLLFFNKFKSQIIAKEKNGILIDATHDKSFESTKKLNVGLLLNKKGWFVLGIGDGYSRWMLWENLEKMPRFYFTV
jgi:hypothetical protein